MTPASFSITRPPRGALLLLSFLALQQFSLAGLGDLTSVWQFENNLNESNGGAALTPTDFTPAYSAETIGGASANAIDLPALPATQLLEMPNAVGGNGGSPTLTNEWTLIFDLNFAALSTDAAVLQTGANTTDAEVHVEGGANAGAIRLGGTRVADPGALQTGQWHRLAITSEVSGSNLECKVYLDGVQTLVSGAPVSVMQALDGDYALPATVKLFNDDNNENQAVKVNSVALFGCALTSAELAVLGSPVAPGCPDLVVSNANNDGAGSLRGAIDNVRSGGIISFDFSVSGGTITLGSGGEFDITGRTMDIDARHLAVRPTVDAADSFRIFNVLAGSDVTVRGLRMIGGSAALGEEGGAVHNESLLTLERCEISNSSADVGGGIFNESGATLVVTECTISGNNAGAGGGISNAGMATLNRCTISGNTAGSTGGLEDINNTTLTNCTIANNSATDGGGGGLSGFGTLTLYNCTVSGNNAVDLGGFDGGGGIHVDFVANVTIENCIVAGNTSNVPSEDNIGGFGFPNQSGANLTSGDPMIQSLGDFGGPTHTMAPEAGSPAAAAGIVTGNTPATDQRGFARIDNVMDIGSVETPFDQNTTLYTEWAVNNISDPNQRGFFDDPDGDRVDNILEYAFRMDPDLFDSLSQPLAYREPPTVLHADLEIVIPFRNTATDIIYIIQETNDLQIWSEIYRYNVLTSTETVTDPNITTAVDTGNQTITVTEANANFNPVTTFWRVGVQTNP